MLTIGIVGLPNVGKSSLFNALTKNDILVANYPFATIEPNIGVVNIPDKRLIKLQEIYNSQKTTYANIQFIDIAGLVEGASRGEGLGNKFLHHIRQVDMIVQVLRVFQDQDTIHVNDQINPENDKNIVNTELVLADLKHVNGQIEKLTKLLKSDPKLEKELNLLIKVKALLEDNQPLWTTSFEDEYKLIIKKQDFLTLKPIIYVFNLDEQDLKKQDLKNELTKIAHPNQAIFLSAKLENELKNLDENETKELLDFYDIKESGLEQLVQQSYQILGLQSFLTAGQQEVRAWTISQNTLAPDAAAVIHNDFKRGFIAAEITDYNDLIHYGSYIKTKQAGKVRIEGKNYIMQPNDIVDFKFNVSGK